MSLADELRDPWTWVVSGLAGGMAGTVSEPGVGVLVGVAVFATKVLTGLATRLGNRGSRSATRFRRLPVATRTPEAAWLARAQRAQHAFEDIAAAARAGPVAEHVQSLDDETHDALLALERLAGQATAIRMAIARLNMKQLVWERDRLLAASRPNEHPQVLAERQRSLNSVQSQIDAFERLDRALAMVIARLESGTLAIEGLVARLAEIIALAETSVTSTDGVAELDELVHELEGLRAGLVEAESISTRAMQGLAPLPAPGAGSVPSPGETKQTPARRRAGGE